MKFMKQWEMTIGTKENKPLTGLSIVQRLPFFRPPHDSDIQNIVNSQYLS